MDFNSIKNMKASELDSEFVLTIINEAYNKSDEIMEEILEQVEDETIDYNYETTQKVIMCNILGYLISISESIGDLSNSITMGAVDHLEDTMGLSDEDILDMDDDVMETALKPYLDLQHKFADFNNKELRDMLFETAKHILTPVEIMSIYLGF